MTSHKLPERGGWRAREGGFKALRNGPSCKGLRANSTVSRPFLPVRHLEGLLPVTSLGILSHLESGKLSQVESGHMEPPGVGLC
ncbi:MAG: hypothetical protein HY665_04020 [Chloroflexi bacterium]|nr:hypothetical protein [Chloroflexota bacterium]